MKVALEAQIRKSSKQLEIETMRRIPSTVTIYPFQFFVMFNPINLKLFVYCMVLLIGLLPVTLQATEKLNIVLFLVDDMGVMDTSVPFLTDDTSRPKKHPLNDFYQTPAMERLAEQGIRFNQFAAKNVCSPTRISLLTGQNSARHRTTNWINPYQNNRQQYGPSSWNWSGLNSSSVTLPRILQAAGYRTIHIGKAHFGPEDSEGSDPTQLGFNVNIGGASIGHPGSYFAAKGFGQGTRHAVPHLDHYHGSDLFLTDALTLEAKKEITKSAQAGEPFFLHLSHYAVHTPFESDPRFANHYSNSGRSKPAQAFATLISGIDHSLGEVLNHLESLGIAEDTLVIFLGDNGTDAPLGPEHAIACAEPLRGKKGDHYEGATRVPMIVAWAKPNPDSIIQQRLPIPSNMIQPHLASVCDVYPTILELLALPNPEGHPVDGSSLISLIKGSDANAHPNEFLLHFPHEHRSSYFTSLRQGNWKLIYHYNPTNQESFVRDQLFDLENDPSETVNLAAIETNRLSEMKLRMIKLLEKYDAAYPQDATGSPIKIELD